MKIPLKPTPQHWCGFPSPDPIPLKSRGRFFPALVRSGSFLPSSVTFFKKFVMETIHW